MYKLGVESSQCPNERTYSYCTKYFLSKEKCLRSALNYAVIDLKLEMVQFLVEEEGTDVNFVDCHIDTPLSLAIEEHHFPIMKYLVEKGANVDFYKNGKSLLQSVSSQGFQKTVKFLLKNGADVNFKDIYGRTSLHMASFSGHLNVVKLLVEEGKADVCATNRNGESSLLLALINDKIEIVKYLLKKIPKNQLFKSDDPESPLPLLIATLKRKFANG